MAQQPPKTRAAASVYGLGPAVSKDDLHLPKSKLPTVRLILRALKYLATEKSDTGNRSYYDCAKALYPQIEALFGMAGIPLQSKGADPKFKEVTVCKKLVKILEDDKSFRKIPRVRRSKEQLDEYSKTLDKTCTLWPDDAMDQIRNDEDKRFLESMMSDRKASIGGLDLKEKQKEDRKKQRHEKSVERTQKSQRELTEQFEVCSQEPLLDVDEPTDDEAEKSPTPKRKHRRIAKTGTAAFVPHNILEDPELQQHCERMGLTPTQTASFTRKLVEKSGGDASKISCSYSTADR